MNTLFKHRDPIGTGIYPLPNEPCQKESILKEIEMSRVKGKTETIFYIHIPFCKKFCSYCGIKKFHYDEDLLDDYVDALRTEIKTYQDHFPNRELGSVYFGGGTATLLSKGNWKRILSQLFKTTKSDDYEITVEGTPEGFSPEHLSFFKDNGVNRVSIGVQSLVGTVNHNLSRFYNLKDLDKIINNALSAIGNVNVDLIYNLPGQTIESFESDLKALTGMGITHLTINPFVVLKSAPIYKRMLADVRYRPSEKMEIQLFEHALKTLGELNFTQYSVRDFCQYDKQCKYIVLTAYCHDVIGIGFGSYGFLNGFSYRNCSTSIEDYMQSIEKYGSSIAEINETREQDFINKMMIQGFRLTDFSLKKAEKQHQHPITEIFKNEIHQIETQGLVKLNNGKIEFSHEGLIYANNIRAMFDKDIDYLGFGLESFGDSNRSNYE